MQTLEKAKEPLPDYGFRLTVCEDNEATIKIVLKKRSQAMRHIRRTHRINLDWLYEIFETEEVGLRYVRTTQQIADILTKHFSNSTTWLSLLDLLGLRASDPKLNCQGGPGTDLKTQSKTVVDTKKPRLGGPRQKGSTGKSIVCGLAMMCTSFRSPFGSSYPSTRSANQVRQSPHTAMTAASSTSALKMPGWTGDLQAAKLAYTLRAMRDSTARITCDDHAIYDLATTPLEGFEVGELLAYLTETKEDGG